MDQIIVEGVRCFRNLQTVPLRPMTLLVGENSSGKSTFLALARLASQLCHGKTIVNFNEEPFLLGAYDQIASSQGGKSGNAAGFTIGAQIAASSFRHGLSDQVGEYLSVSGHFTKQEAQPKLDEWSINTSGFGLQLQFKDAPTFPRVIARTPSGRRTWTAVTILKDELPGVAHLFYALDWLQRESPKMNGNAKANHGNELPGTEQRQLIKLVDAALLAVGPFTPYAFAPVRSHPKRTYDPIKDVRSPEGSHIPMILARLSSSEQKNWESLRKTLNSFGKASGLFSDIEVRRIGREESDPFQIKIKVASSAFNLMDVGYGVSQVLPIVVDVVRGRKGGTYLLQQPEVHLHPKAQAELGSFLGTLAKTDQKRFVIETHSDYLVDRVRQEVRNKRLSPDDVALLYFERLNGHVEIRHLELDQAGNIINAPASYRQFFLAEEMRLLGFGE